MMNEFENERNQQLIDEREEYESHESEVFQKQIDEFENSYISSVVENMLNSEEFNNLIEQRLDYIYNAYDFEPLPDYDYFEDIFYDEYEPYPDYPEGDIAEGYDYPDGPNENLQGVYYPDEYREPPMAYFDKDDYYEYLIDEICDKKSDSEEEHMQDLIKQHLQEEKDYLDSIVEDALQEGYYFPKVVDEAILDYMDFDFYEDEFDYDSAPQYWYDKPDESVKEPFDSFDEIDYPEDRVEVYEPPAKNEDFDMMGDYKKYRRNHPSEVFESFSPDQIPEPPEVIAFTKDEKEKLKERFLEYFKKEDKLDKIVKEKFNQKRQK